MRSCSYCGKENNDASGVCANCGESLVEPSISLSFPWLAFLSWVGLGVGIMGTGSVVLSSYPFFLIHNDIGPGVMFWMIGIFWTAVVTFLIGLPCGILAIKKGKQ